VGGCVDLQIRGIDALPDGVNQDLRVRAHEVDLSGGLVSREPFNLRVLRLLVKLRGDGENLGDLLFLKSPLLDEKFKPIPIGWKVARCQHDGSIVLESGGDSAHELKRKKQRVQGTGTGDLSINPSSFLHRIKKDPTTIGGGHEGEGKGRALTIAGVEARPKSNT